MTVNTWGSRIRQALAIGLGLLGCVSSLGFMLAVDFTELTLGVLLFHLLVFDPRWLGWLRPGPVASAGDPRLPGPTRSAA